MYAVGRRQVLGHLTGLAAAGLTLAGGETAWGNVARAVPGPPPVAGSRIWYFQAGPGLAQPVVTGDGEVFAGVGGRVDYTSGTYAISAATGKQAWHRQNAADPVPYVVKGKVLYGVGGEDNNVIYASRAATGQPLWTFEASHLNAGAGNLWPGYADGAIFTSAHLHGEPVVLAVTAETGRLRWTRPFPAPAAGMASADSIIYAGLPALDGNGAGRVVALDARDGRELWQADGLAVVPDTLVVAAGTVCGCSTIAGSTTVFDIAVSRGVVYVGCFMGGVYALSA